MAFLSVVLGGYGGTDTKEEHHATIEQVCNLTFHWHVEALDIHAFRLPVGALHNRTVEAQAAAVVDLVAGKRELGSFYYGHVCYGGGYDGGHGPRYCSGVYEEEEWKDQRQQAHKRVFKGRNSD